MASTSARKSTVAWLIVVMAICLTPIALFAQFWPQWALDAQHTGQVGVAGQPLNHILANIVYDPLVPAEESTSNESVPPVSETVAGPAAREAAPFVTVTWSAPAVGCVIENVPLAEPSDPSVRSALPESERPLLAKSSARLPLPVETMIGVDEMSPSWL